jgi:hypothetical protein
MKRCGCTACLLQAALVLLRGGRVSMAATLIEQALEQVERQQPKQVAPPARRGSRRARP